MSDIQFVIRYGPEKHRRDFKVSFKRWEFWALVATLNFALVAEALTIAVLIATR